MLFKSISFLFLFFNLIYALQRPPYIAACHRNDPELNKCGEINARKAIPILTQGDPVYKIPNMKPMHIDRIELPQITNIKLTMSNITVRGLDTASPRNFNFNLTTRNITFEVFLSRLEITGDYQLTGRLLIFPLEGNGKANITYVDGVYIYPMHYEYLTKKGIKYIDIVDHSMTFTPKRGYFYFENLFNGNKLLADQILTFMDDNWKEVNNDFGPLVADAIDTIVTSTANAILNRVPYDDVFLP